MRIIRDRARGVDLVEFLSRPLFGYLATASDAGPRVSPVWFLWEGDAVWIIGNRKTDTFPTRIEQDPRSAFTVVDFDREDGRVHHVGMRGRARLIVFDKERAKRLLQRYLGRQVDRWDEERFIEPLDDPDNVFIKFEPETVVARDQSYRPSPSHSVPNPPRDDTLASTRIRVRLVNGGPIDQPRARAVGPGVVRVVAARGDLPDLPVELRRRIR